MTDFDIAVAGAVVAGAILVGWLGDSLRGQAAAGAVIGAVAAGASGYVLGPMLLQLALAGALGVTGTNMEAAKLGAFLLPVGVAVAAGLLFVAGLKKPPKPQAPVPPEARAGRADPDAAAQGSKPPSIAPSAGSARRG